MIERLHPEDKVSWSLHYAEHKQRYEYFKSYYANKKVLDAACGIGYGSNIISNYAESVVGIDVSEEAIEFAKMEYKKDNSTFKTLNCYNIKDLRSKFDAVTSFETIEHLSDVDCFIAEVRGVLNNDGYFICSIPNIYRHKLAGIENEHHLSEMPLEDLIEKVQRHFFVEKVLYQNESPEFERFVRTIEHFDHIINRNQRKIKSSVMLRFENSVRRVFRKNQIKFEKQRSYPRIGKSVDSDFEIKVYTPPSNWQKTFILIARPKQ